MPMPVAPHAFSMTWTHGLFAHWPFDPGQIRPHVPDVLELDTFDGQAWVSLLPFVLADAGIRCTPSFTRLTFPELNFRTYVQYDDTPGLYFFSIDVGHPVIPSLVGELTRLPCYYADISVQSQNNHVRFDCIRRHPNEPASRFEASYRPTGPIFHADPGTLEYWLAERRRMYDPVGKKVLYAEIAHDPWPLQPSDVTIDTNTMFESSMLPAPPSEPRFSFSKTCSMTGSLPRWIRRMNDDTTVQPDRLTGKPPG